MLITRLEAEGIFSFGVGDDRFALDLGQDLTVVVGPNASGKSNISRVLNLVQSAMRYEDANQEDRNALYTILDDHVLSARHDGMPRSTPSSVRLSIRLNSPREIGLLTTYVQSLVMSALVGNQVADDPSVSTLEGWIAEHVNSNAIADLFVGTVVISHSGIRGTPWNVAYEFEHDDEPFTWHIQTSIPNLRSTIAPRDWKANTDGPVVMTATQRLTGGVTLPPGEFKPPYLPFSLDVLLPNEEALARVEIEPISANVAPAPHRAFVELAGITIAEGDPLGAYRGSYSLASVLWRILDRGLRFLGVAGTSLEMPSGGMGLIGTSDRQLSSPVPRSDIFMLPNRLMTLKNGSQASQARYQAIQDLFTELAPGHRFEMHSWMRRRGTEEPKPVLEIEVFPAGASPHSAPAARPLRFAGTGTEQALVIAETLVGDPERVLVLDEPATNLHPSWQRIVRSHLCSREGQCLLVTHSPYLIPTEGGKQLASIVRFSMRNGATRPFRLRSEDLTNDQWISSLMKELAWSADARGLMFAGGVVLVEGDTELTALPTWFSKSPTAAKRRAPDDLHIMAYSVGGDSGFRNFISYLDRFGVPWAVVCDGAAFRLDRTRHVFEQVIDAGVDDAELSDYVAKEISGNKDRGHMDQTLFNSMVEVGQEHGVFTLAHGWHLAKEDKKGGDESFEAFLERKPELAEAHRAAKVEVSRSKPRVGRIVGESTDCPREVDELYGRILRRLWGQGMPRYPEL